MRKRTEAEWRSYLRATSNLGLVSLARRWGMTGIAHENCEYRNKEQRINILLTHLDVMGKILSTEVKK